MIGNEILKSETTCMKCDVQHQVRMNRKSKSFGRRSSILKLDGNLDNDTAILKNRRSMRRVSFAETYQVKEFPRDSPRIFKDVDQDEEIPESVASGSQTKSESITGLDKLLTGDIQTSFQSNVDFEMSNMGPTSFNLFDKTTLEPVDMETTYAGGEFFTDMNFQSEPSVELTFDASSLLRSLKGKSDSLKPLQIYSPDRDRNIADIDVVSFINNDRIPLNINFSDHDKENIMVPIESMQTIGNKSGPGSKDFIDRLLGRGSGLNSSPTSLGENMEITGCANDDPDKENKIDQASKTQNMEMTVPIGGILNSSYAAAKSKPSKSGGLQIKFDYSDGNDVDNCTRQFNLNDNDQGMEETKCLGGILNTGGKMNTTSNDNVVTSSKFGETMNTSLGAHMKISNAPDSKMSNVTINLIDNIEETKVVGGILDRFDNKADTANNDVDMDFTMDDPKGVPMEETKALGTIVITKPGDSHGVKTDLSINRERDETVKLDLDMEETKPVGGILNYEKGDLFNRSKVSTRLSFGSSDKTTKLPEPMEETRPVGGILDKYFGEKSGSGNNLVRSPTDQMNMTINKTVPMEETKPLGNICNETTDRTLYFEDVNTDWTLHNLKNKEIGKLSDGTIFSKQQSTVYMDETKCITGVIDVQPSSKVTIETENIKDPQNEDKVVDQTGVNTPMGMDCMEETKCVTGVIELKPFSKESFVSENETLMTENAGIDSNQKEKSAFCMEETKCVTGIIEVNPSENESLSFGKKSLTKEFAENVPYPSSTRKQSMSDQMEETRCLTSVIDVRGPSGTSSSEDLVRANIGKVSSNSGEHNEMTHCMEETKCVTTVIETGQKTRNEDIASNQNDEIQTRNDRTVFDETDMQLTKAHSTSRTDIENETLLPLDDMEVDDEITFKGSKHKRDYDECRDNDDKTRDITQTTTNLAKLRERLIDSSRKSLSKTPSKISPMYPNPLTLSASKGACAINKDINATRSPAHKRQKLFDSPHAMSEDTSEGDENAERINGDLDVHRTASQNALFSLAGDGGYVSGIDDEQMPETMNFTSSSGSRHSVSSYNTNSTTQNETNVTNSSHSSMNDTRNSSSINMSVMSNKSCTSFMIHDGPMTLDKFYKLTYSLKTNIKASRCSTAFVPSIDYEDLAEVLEVNLTVAPRIKAKKKCKDKFVELTNKSQEGIDWLEKTLEESQPEIFQQCMDASSDELSQISSELRSMLQACHKLVYITWKDSTNIMLDEILQDIQENGIRKAEEILNQTQNNHKNVDYLLASIDEDLKDLDENGETLNNIAHQEEILKLDLEKLQDQINSETKVKEQLGSAMIQHMELDKYKKDESTLSEQILSLLICTEWHLEGLDERKATFSFLNDSIELCVEFTSGVEEKVISNITLNTVKLSDNCSLKERVAIDFVSRGIDIHDLQKKFSTISSLPKLLLQVSSTVNEIRQFCTELDQIQTQHTVKLVDNRFITELWNVETIDFITLELIFNVSNPLTKPVSCSVSVQIGKHMSTDIEKCLHSVEPGRSYLRRLIESVDFNHLNTR
ncbi:Cancer susceptibility candidate 5 [Mactra antiquata]